MYLEQGIKGKNRWWRYLVTGVITVFGIVLGNIPLGFFLVIGIIRNGQNVAGQFQTSMDFSLLGLPPAAGLVLIMCPFVFGLAALLLGIRFVHGKKIKDLTTGVSRVRFSHFFWAAGLWMALGMGADGLSWLLKPEDYTVTFNAARFFPVLLAALLTVPLQAGFEEYFFRGYLSQGLAGLFKGKGLRWGRIVPVLVTGILFGTLHITNPEIRNYGLLFMLPQYILMGILLSVVTVMDDGLEAALGIHTANNLYGILIVNFEGTAVQMPSLFMARNYDPKTGLLAMVIFMAVSLILFKLVFKWPGFKKVIAPLKIVSV